MHAVTIKLSAIAEATISLATKPFTSNNALVGASDFETGARTPLLPSFSYLATPFRGYDVSS
jgi:hypothetical protein